MPGALEQSLDSIIGDNSSARGRETRGSGPRRDARRRNRGGPRPQRFDPANYNGIPNQIASAAEGRPMLRLRNIHPDLNGMDLSNLLATIAPVDFVKFDPRNETIAYVCFQLHYIESNNRAILKFDGKKAMGKTLIVENAASLADRIAPTKNNNSRGSRDKDSTLHAREQHRVRAQNKEKAERAKKVRPAKKTAEDLDSELSAYMNAGSDNPEPTHSASFAAQANGETAMD